MPDRLPPGAPTPEQLDRYLAGESSPGERAVVRRYLDEHPELARTLHSYVRGLDAEASRPQPPDAAASFAALKRRIAEEEQVDAGPDGEVRRSARAPATRVAIPPAASRRWGRAVRTGALVAAAVVATVFYERSQHRPAPRPRIYTTADGQRADVHLMDGTRVRIAPGSRLRVASDFGRERRDVYLDGEAYFEVAHDARRPFTVYAGNASARDLGTAFAVRAFPEDGAVQVAVRAGVVALSGVGRLAAGDVGRLGADGRASVEHGVDVDEVLAWTTGRLDFSDAPLRRVLADVHRWYGVDVGLSDTAFAELPFTGTLSDLTPSDAVALVAATLGMRVERDGERFVLHPIPGRTPRPRAASRAPR